MTTQNFETGPLNIAQVDPELRDLMDLVVKEVFLSLNCHAVGTVQSFDPSTQTATITLDYTKTIYRKDPISGAYKPVQVEYPPLTNVPVYVLGDGATCSLTFPIQAGAKCSILFHDRDLSNWFATGQVGPLPSNALHAFGDAVALIGIRPIPSVLSGYDMVRAVLQNGTTMVGVGPAKVKVANGTTTLNTVLQNLITQLGNLCAELEALTVTCTGPGNPSSVPVNAGAITATAALIAAIGTQMGGLLE